MGWARKVKYPIVEAGPSGPLTAAERIRFDELCGIIDRGIGSWIEVGKALYELSPNSGPSGGGQRLYRGTHRTFTEFVRDRWGFGKSQAYRLMDSAYRGERVQRFLDSSTPRNLSPAGDKSVELLDAPLLREPAVRERHVRAMHAVPVEQEEAVIKRALASGGELTAAKVAQAAKEICGTAREQQADKRKDYKARIRKVMHRLATLQRELESISRHGGARVLGREWKAPLQAVYDQLDGAVKCS